MQVGEKIECWDRLLDAARSTLRARGLREIITPCRVAEVALEPFIEPLLSERGLLRTSPELAHKTLICAGARDFFEVAAVFRRGERGALHREEFHLLEWYRVAATAGQHGPQLASSCLEDLEAVVEAAFDALLPYTGRSVQRNAPARTGTGEWTVPRAGEWLRVSFFELFEETVGVTLRGDESAHALIARLRAVRPKWVGALLGDRAAHRSHTAANGQTSEATIDPEAAHLGAWTALWSLWSDQELDPWLASQRHPVHLAEFPAALAALAELRPRVDAGPLGAEPQQVALRVESYVSGVELGNSYVELRDPHEQQRRFAAVRALMETQEDRPDGCAAWMDAHWPRRFLSKLQNEPLPPCAGLAMGLERLLCVALGHEDLAQVLLADDLRP